MSQWHASSPGRQRHWHDGGLPPLSAPPPTAGGDLPPSQPAPHFGFPLQPTLGFAAPPTAGEGEGYPFIGSNPTVPLPTGMTDTATVLPLPDTAGDKVLHCSLHFFGLDPLPLLMNHDDFRRSAGGGAGSVRSCSCLHDWPWGYLRHRLIVHDLIIALATSTAVNHESIYKFSFHPHVNLINSSLLMVIACIPSNVPHSEKRNEKYLVASDQCHRTKHPWYKWQNTHR